MSVKKIDVKPLNYTQLPSDAEPSQEIQYYRVQVQLSPHIAFKGSSYVKLELIDFFDNDNESDNKDLKLLRGLVNETKNLMSASEQEEILSGVKNLLNTETSIARRRIIYSIKLDYADDASIEIMPALHRELFKLTDDQTLRILSLKKGSLIVELEGTEEGYRQLIELINGGLAAILGNTIQSIKIERRSTLSAERHSNTGSYSLSNMRKLLNLILVTDSMLEAFILDFFPRTKASISNSMDRIQKTSLLLELEEKEAILANLKQEYPLELEIQSRNLIR